MVKDFALPQNIRRNAVQLGQIQRLHAQPLQRRLGVCCHRRTGEVSRPSGGAAAPQFGGDEDAVGFGRQELTEEFFAAASAVDVCCVKERRALRGGGG